MVRILIAYFMLFPLFVFSGEFTASVNRNQVNLGESLVLNLTLKDVAAKTNPSIDALRKVFLVSSQQQSSNTMIVNGRTTTSINWKLSLHPQKEGELTIPSITIETAQGRLATKPITVRVGRGAATDRSDSPEGDSVSLTTDVSSLKPFKNEPVVYTIRLTSKYEMTNIKMQKVDIPDAIVEVNQEPNIYEKIVDGINLQVLEFRYFITPLKPGSLKIPSTIIQGSIPMKRKNSRRSFFDDDFDPFSMIQGFDRLHPFALATEALTLEVQPPIPNITPWLPARYLAIQEVWNGSESPQAGEPLTRELIIVAEGVNAAQLPSLSEFHTSNNILKIYADKPETGDEFTDYGVKSRRKEIYTILPQQAGSVTLPEIVLEWWDVRKGEKALAVVPARTFQVQPSAEKISGHSQDAEDKQHHQPNEAVPYQLERDPFVYILIATLAVLLTGTILWGISLQRKISRMAGVPKQKADVKKRMEAKDKNDDIKYAPPSRPAKKEKNEKLPDLNPT